MIKAKTAKEISEKEFNEALFKEYLTQLDILIYRKAIRNETSAHLKVLNENYAIKLRDYLETLGYTSGYYIDRGYNFFCNWG